MVQSEFRSHISLIRLWQLYSLSPFNVRLSPLSFYLQPCAVRLLPLCDRRSAWGGKPDTRHLYHL